MPSGFSKIHSSVDFSGLFHIWPLIAESAQHSHILQIHTDPVIQSRTEHNVWKMCWPFKMAGSYMHVHLLTSELQTLHHKQEPLYHLTELHTCCLSVICSPPCSAVKQREIKWYASIPESSSKHFMFCSVNDYVCCLIASNRLHIFHK